MSEPSRPSTPVGANAPSPVALKGIDGPLPLRAGENYFLVPERRMGLRQLLTALLDRIHSRLWPG